MDLKESVNDQYDILENLKGSVGNLNDIILRLTQHVIASTAGKTSNLVFSPALLSVILSFVAASSPDELNAVSSGIVTTILADSTPSGGPTISAANGVWIEKTLYVEPSFKDLLLNSYKAAFNQVDFRTKADEVNKEVNSWVEEQTNGLITDLLPPNSASSWTDLIFANALFFNGRWDSQFNPSLTKESDFHLLDGTKVRVPFMTGAHEDSLDVYEGFKVLNLPYREGREDSRGFSMQIYLPDEKDGLPAVRFLASLPLAFLLTSTQLLT
ncbi:putative Serpin family protein [Arabidopsis thaliana]